MGNVLNTNVLIIGKSGVGKSSLLNYIFDKEIEKTGCGKPITEKRIFSHKYCYDENFNITIHDTWGLEPDKKDKWENLIMDEVHSHDKQTVKEWFNTIIFCISKSSRFENFEIDIVKRLLQEKNKILFVITHCDNEDDEEAVRMRDAIIKETKVKSRDVVMACSVEKKLIGEKNKQTRFGKDKIIVAIISNLWDTLKDKVPHVVNKAIDEIYDKEKNKLYDLVEKQNLLFRRDEKLKEFQENVNTEFDTFVEKVSKNINGYFKSTISYYNELTKKYVQIGGLLDEKKLRTNPAMKYDVVKNFEKEVDDDIKVIQEKLEYANKWLYVIFTQEISKNTIKKLRLAIKEYITSTSAMKKELYNQIDKYLNDTKRIIKEQIDDIVRRIKRINVGEICEKQLLSVK